MNVTTLIPSAPQISQLTGMPLRTSAKTGTISKSTIRISQAQFNGRLLVGAESLEAAGGPA